MKLKPLFALIILSIATLFVFADITGGEYIGYRHKGVVYGETLPNGVRDLGGGLLSDEDYGVTRFVKGEKYMLWFEKIIDRDEEGVPEWEVKDVLIFKKLKKYQQFFFSYTSPCTENGKENLDLIVLAELNSRRKTYKPLNAWRANVERERFDSVSIEAVECNSVK